MISGPGDSVRRPPAGSGHYRKRGPGKVAQTEGRRRETAKEERKVHGGALFKEGRRALFLGGQN